MGIVDGGWQLKRPNRGSGADPGSPTGTYRFSPLRDAARPVSVGIRERIAEGPLIRRV